MTQPGFRTDTDALRWYATRCGAVGEDVDRLREGLGRFGELPAPAWGGKIMYLTLLKESLDQLRDSYDAALAATTTRLGKIALQLAITETNLHRVADAYDAADEAAGRRMPR